VLLAADYIETWRPLDSRLFRRDLLERSFFESGGKIYARSYGPSKQTHTRPNLPSPAAANSSGLRICWFANGKNGVIAKKGGGWQPTRARSVHLTRKRLLHRDDKKNVIVLFGTVPDCRWLGDLQPNQVAPDKIRRIRLGGDCD